MSVLSNLQIEAIAHLCKIRCHTCCVDELPSIVPTNASEPVYVVYNHSRSTDLDGGTHWSGLVYTKNMAYTVDSYGRYPLPELVAFCKSRGVPLMYSATQIQDDKSVDCGWWALGYVIWFDRNYRTSDPNTIIERWLDTFSEYSYKHNDTILVEFWKLVRGGQ